MEERSGTEVGSVSVKWKGVGGASNEQLAYCTELAVCLVSDLELLGDFGGNVIRISF